MSLRRDVKSVRARRVHAAGTRQCGRPRAGAPAGGACLEIYQGKNEQGQTHVAVAFAKHMKRKQIMAVTSSVGPGAANMVTACATATANNIPVLVLPGDVYACRQPDPVLQQIEQMHDLSLSTNDAFRPVCRYWDRIARPDQLMSAMINAFRVLTDPADTGAVCIALPQDVEGEAYDYPESFFAKRVWTIERRPATEIAIAQAARRFARRRNRCSSAAAACAIRKLTTRFARLPRRTGIPFGETQAGKSAVVWDHPLNLGGVGVTGCSVANAIAREADCIIGVGTRYTDFTTSSKWLFREDAKFVNINVSEFQAHKLDAWRSSPMRATRWRSCRRRSRATGPRIAARSKPPSPAGTARTAGSASISFGEGYVPEINDANAQSAFRYAKDVNAQLTQTTALAAINRLMTLGTPSSARPARCRAACSACGARAARIPTTWNTAIPAWAMRSPARWA